MQHKNLRGSDLHSPSSELIENNSGSTIAVLKAVKFNGMGTFYPQVLLANGPVELVRGITQTAIPTGSSGYITCLGFLNGVDTSTWAVGTKLFADASGSVVASASGLPVAVVMKQHATQGIIYVENTGVTKADLDALQFPDALSLELQWDINNPSYYSELTYTLGQVTAMDVYTDSTKILKLFNKVYSYTGPLLTGIVITRISDGSVMTKVIVYSGGKVINVTTTVV